MTANENHSGTASGGDLGAESGAVAVVEPPRETSAAKWTFLSNHAHVLICLARNPEMRLRDVAERVGITERGVQKIVGELEEAGVIRIEKEGRRNRYEINAERPLRHAVESHKKVKDLLDAVL